MKNSRVIFHSTLSLFFFSNQAAGKAPQVAKFNSCPFSLSNSLMRSAVAFTIA
jgi:hypothetical protein